MNHYLKQEQKLKLSPSLYHSMHILGLDIIDLNQEIMQQLDENPALEQRDDDDVSANEYLVYQETGEYSIDFLSCPSQTLQEHLLEQLGWLNLDDTFHRLAVLVVQNLDERGFHQLDPVLLDPLFCSPLVLSKVLYIVRQLEPIGCATLNSFETLAVQIAHDTLYTSYSAEQIARAATLWAQHQIDELSILLSIPRDEVSDFFIYLKSLCPYPGLIYGVNRPKVVYPELLLTVTDHKLSLRLIDQYLPKLTINTFFTQLAATKSDSEEHHYAKKQCYQAKLFINTIKQRQQTLFRVASAIVEYQKDFFIKGRHYLKPLTLKHISEELGLHETTISRAIAGKYLQTSKNIISLKKLFNSGMVNIYGQNISREVIKDEIGAILKASGGAKISDQKIVAILKRMGHQIARRTVSKYRLELASKG